MLTPLLSPFANILHFVSGIPEKYWKSGFVSPEFYQAGIREVERMVEEFEKLI